MLRIFAILFGIAFIFIGVAGFLPAFIINGQLFGFFAVNTLHSIFEIIAGVLAIMAATSYYYTRRYFRVIGIIFIIVAIVGFWRSGDLFIMRMSTADNILHLLVGALAVYLGFFFQRIEVNRFPPAD